MDRKWSFLATVVLALAMVTGIARGSAKPDSATDEMRVRIYDGYLIVADGSVNGLPGLRFLLDTGTSVTAIDRRVAKRLGLVGQPTTVLNVDKMVPVEWGSLSEISFGQERATDVPILIEDLRYLHAGKVQVDGIIGLDLLGRRSFLVDYAASRVLFGVTEASGMRSAPLRTDGMTLTVQVELNGRQAWMVADTGVRRTILYERGLETASETTYRVLGSVTTHSMGGSVENRMASISELRVGGQYLNTEALFVKPPTTGKLADVAGYLGPAELHAKQVLFDFESNQLRWKK
jgi:hypothetical protein